MSIQCSFTCIYSQCSFVRIYPYASEQIIIIHSMHSQIHIVYTQDYISKFSAFLYRLFHEDFYLIIKINPLFYVLILLIYLDLPPSFPPSISIPPSIQASIHTPFHMYIYSSVYSSISISISTSIYLSSGYLCSE